MKLRAVIYGIQEFEESPVDYTVNANIMAIQQAIAATDPISFVNPDNVHVHVVSSEMPLKEQLKEVLKLMEKTNG